VAGVAEAEVVDIGEEKSGWQEQRESGETQKRRQKI
jgi:hypothetical protein